MPAPFRRGSYEALPEKPARSHDWFEIPEQRLLMRSAPFGDVEIAYRVRGSGPPLLLIHGLMTSGYSWRYVFKSLAEKYRVFVPDLPGSGSSGKPVARYSGTAYAAWIAELVDALGIRGCRCIGNSLGGYLSMRAVLANAEERPLFQALINLHSPGVLEARLRALSLAMKIPGMRAMFAWWVRGSPLRFAHANVHYYHEGLKSLEEARVYGEPLASVEGSRAFANILGDVLAPAELLAFAAALKEKNSFPIPLLLLYADRDPMVPAWIGPRLHAMIPGSELQILKDTSHFAHVDTPELVLAAAQEFFEKKKA
jgi:pimeloyl-ACP methyl ester carboxylesterase